MAMRKNKRKPIVTLDVALCGPPFRGLSSSTRHHPYAHNSLESRLTEMFITEKRSPKAGPLLEKRSPKATSTAATNSTFAAPTTAIVSSPDTRYLFPPPTPRMKKRINRRGSCELVYCRPQAASDSLEALFDAPHVVFRSPHSLL
eukprot:JP436598.1.p1 GENE.JP436598.1~~JP436598.1.p1  ORF type:complete len:145 (-),score=0.09 JP436598.1:184-618(-)